MRKQLQTRTPLRVLFMDLLFLLSFGSLCVGFFAPILNVTKNIWFIQLTNTTFSLYSGIKAFFETGQYGVGGVLLAFTVIFPLSKLIILNLLWRVKISSRIFQKLLFLLGHIGHFSMLDVFVVAVIVAIIKMNAMAEARALWGLYVFTLHVVTSICLTIGLKVQSRKMVLRRKR